MFETLCNMCTMSIKFNPYLLILSPPATYGKNPLGIIRVINYMLGNTFDILLDVNSDKLSWHSFVASMKLQLRDPGSSA